MLALGFPQFIQALGPVKLVPAVVVLRRFRLFRLLSVLVLLFRLLARMNVRLPRQAQKSKRKPCENDHRHRRVDQSTLHENPPEKMDG